MSKPDKPAQPRKPWLALLTRIGVGAGALVLAIAIFATLRGTAPQTEPAEGVATPIRVQVLSLDRIPIARQWRGHGTVAAVNRADVPAQVSAVVDTITNGIDEGARVTADTPLVMLDAEVFVNQAEIARQNVADLTARLKQLDINEARLTERKGLEEELVAIAEEDLARQLKFKQSQAGTQQGVDRARNALINAQRALSATMEQIDSLVPQKQQLVAQQEAQKASLAVAELNEQRCRIKSPIDGIVAALDVKVGENLAPGQRVLRVVGLSRVEVPLFVPATARTDLVVGDPVELRSASRPDRVWNAKVSRIRPLDDQATRTTAFFAEVEQPNAEAAFGTPAGGELLIPGSFVTGMISSRDPQPRWVVPRRAIRNGRVLLANDDVIRSCEVTPDFTYEGTLPGMGITDTQWVVLDAETTPFKPGDRIVLNVSVTLPEGATVEQQVVNTTPAAKKPQDAPAEPGGGS